MNNEKGTKPAHLLDDPCLKPHIGELRFRQKYAEAVEARTAGPDQDLDAATRMHETFGLHLDGDHWVFREWAPNASRICVVGDFNDWEERNEYCLAPTGAPGCWEARVPADWIRHKQRCRLRVEWPGGSGERIPAFARRVAQVEQEGRFDAQVWCPEEPYPWRHERVAANTRAPFIYEAHVGMATEAEAVGTYGEFTRNILPRIADAGYNTVQLMAVQEHPYYGSFGYHVSSFFAPSSRFGTPEELKELVDTAHSLDIAVVFDLVHSHAVKNEVEGIGLYDGTRHQFFHGDERGYHPAWDSYCFNYGRPEVLRFLLSNCRYWLEEFQADGFRFDGVSSMMYWHRGLGGTFGGYDDYFRDVDNDALAYLTLANKLIRNVHPRAITVAEEVSGMPGVAAPPEQGGMGFDYRLAMGIPDFWTNTLKKKDEDWNMDELWHRVTDHRADERVVNYAECHDQAIVGGKTAIFELIGAEMYTAMSKDRESLKVDRGMALHKMIRLATLTGGEGYLNFMGNEFGHPEWIDFPREGNGWSYRYARRQWSLRDNGCLKYHWLADFDRAMLQLAQEHRLLDAGWPVHRYCHDEHNIVAWSRGELLFLFNFHPVESRVDYPVSVPPGEYRLVLDTDREEFGGPQRLAPEQVFFSEPGGNGDDADAIKVYLPARCALVLRSEALT